MITELDKLPYYHRIPKDPYANLAFRRHILRSCADNVEARKEQWQACSQDILYYLNVFGWLRQELDAQSPEVPFITYPYEDVMVMELLHAIYEGHDFLAEKSRGTGATWCVLATLKWCADFHRRQTFLIGSRKEEYVEKTGDPKTLFAKLDFFHRCLPGWLVPEVIRYKLHYENSETESVIDGESTNESFAHGDRRTAIFLDENSRMANGDEIEEGTRDATRCRIFVGTPFGMNHFYRKRNTNIRKIRMHWSIHPVFAKDLFMGDHPLTMEPGALRSSWYDKQCDRSGNAVHIARQLDISYEASEALYFPPSLLERLISDYGQKAPWRGELDFVPNSCDPEGVVELENGQLRLWIRPNENGRLPDDDYGIGIDVSEGLAGPHSSNSVASIGSRVTGVKIGELVSHRLPPHEFAEYVMALSTWLAPVTGVRRQTYVIWENNGPGVPFGRALIGLGHRYYYKKRVESTQGRKRTDQIGWYSNRDNKKQLFDAYLKSLQRRTFVNPSIEALTECGEYIHGQGGTIIHRKSKGGENPAGEGEQHGDRVIADACLNHVMFTKSAGGSKDDKPDYKNAHPFSYVAMRKKYDESLIKGDMRHQVKTIKRRELVHAN